MKKIISAIALCLLCVIGLCGNKAYADMSAPSCVPVYRLYNGKNNEHLYTTDANEKTVLYQTAGWGYEGIGWYAPTSGTPVYRLYNAKLQNHLYTSDMNEINVLTASGDWSVDNFGNPLFYSGGDIPIYRVYNQKLRGLHHLTTDVNEYNVLPSMGWLQEGPAMTCQTLGVPIFTEWYNADNVPEKKEEAEKFDYSTNISNVASYASIEADVAVSGSGKGVQGVIALSSAESIVTFGLQKDDFSGDPAYRNILRLMSQNTENGGNIDNLSSEIANGKKVHLLLVIAEDGKYTGYLDGNKVLTGTNGKLAKSYLESKNLKIYPRLIAAGETTGDTVDANFTNVKVKTAGDYHKNIKFSCNNTALSTDPDLKDTASADNTSHHITGTVTTANNYFGKSCLVQYDREVATHVAKTELPSGGATIENTPATFAIEADVKLNGEGTGSIAKLVMGNQTSAVSFAMQYDEYSGDIAYRSKVAFMIEDVSNNDKGGQRYNWSDYVGKFGQTYHLMFTLDDNGHYVGYINGAEVVSGTNELLSASAAVNNRIFPRLEIAARLNNESVSAIFTNVKVRLDGQYIPGEVFETNFVDMGKGTATATSLGGNDYRLQGKITSLAPDKDWDSDYLGCGSVIMFWRRW